MVQEWRTGPWTDWFAAIFVAAVGRCRDGVASADTISGMCSPDIDRWRLVIPVKGQLTAKSRLHPPAGVARAGLAHAFALDTITAAAAGIPPERLAAIFDDFVTTKRRGLGLGLAISRRIVEQLDGTIAVTSEVGVGTQFTLRFPARASGSAEAAAS